MKHYDVVIVGAATTGSYFAHQLAEQGRSVLVIDALDPQRIGTKYDIYHVAKKDFDRFHLPLPEKGKDWAFEFTDNMNLSAFGKWPKPGHEHVIGMHMHPHTLRMNRWAQEAGAEIIYEARFDHLEYGADGTICGVTYTHNGEMVSVGCGLVADCSGIPSVVRTALPDGYGVENFSIGPEDMFYVNLRYVKYQDPKDYVRRNRSWPYYKTWEAPQMDPEGAILGVGANFSAEYADGVFARFEKAIDLPQYTLQHIERGRTPYRRPPYSMVADGFLAMGDAACLTKPSCGEGVTSAMVQAEIAAEVVCALLKLGKPLTRENLWPINKRYVEVQGRAFASQLATVVGAVGTSAGENDFFFQHNVIFSAETFRAMGEGKELTFGPGEMARTAAVMVLGVITGKVRIKTIRSLLKSMGDGGAVSKVYADYPETPSTFDQWVKRADAAWAACGSMAESAKLAEE